MLLPFCWLDFATNTDVVGVLFISWEYHFIWHQMFPLIPLLYMKESSPQHCFFVTHLNEKMNLYLMYLSAMSISSVFLIVKILLAFMFCSSWFFTLYLKKVKSTQKQISVLLKFFNTQYHRQWKINYYFCLYFKRHFSRTPICICK